MNKPFPATDSTSTSAVTLRQQMLAYFESQAPAIRAEQNPDGSFGSLRMINDQYAFAPLALLYSLPESRYHQSPELLAAIQRGMDHVLHSLDEQGRIEFLGHDGISHGWVFHDWCSFYWQETLMLLRDAVEPTWWQRHADRLQHNLAGHLEGLERTWDQRSRRFERGGDVHNLFIWKALLLYRAGHWWQRPQWRQIGEEILQAAVAAQQPEGWWPEGGPTSTYNLVTAQAVSLYHEWSGHADALAAVARALTYHATFVHPDASPIGTIDGRQSSQGSAPMILPPSFSRFPQGAQFLERIIAHLPQTLPNLHGISMMTSCLAYLRDEPTEPTIPGFELDAPQRIVPGIHTAVIRPHAFCISACGYETIPTASNWRLDRQNLLSVWHPKTGLIVGVGHSKLQPAFSCFNVHDRRGQMHYLHHRPSVQLDGGRLKLAMHYGPTPVSIEAEAVAPDRVRLVFACEALKDQDDLSGYVEAHLLLRGVVGEPLRGAHAKQTLDDRALWWTPEEHGGQLAHHGWTLRLPEDDRVNVQWPLRPFNPYRPDRKSPLDKASLLVCVPLSAAEPRPTFEIQID